MALFDQHDGCPKGSVMKETSFGSYCSLVTATSTSSNNTSSNNNDMEKSKGDVLAQVGSILSGAGNAAGSIICALKGTCQSTTVIHEAPTESPKSGNNVLPIILSLVIGVPILVFLGIFVAKLVKK